MIWQQDQLLQAGKYRIIRQIGGGGFGQTYLAEDCFLDRPVVIKAPNQQFKADQEYQKFVRRFQREGQVLAKIPHPNIVQVIEFFQEAGVPCLVMAYVDGETLYQRIQNRGRLSETEAVQHFRKLAAALQIVHKEDIFHCDIHPGNIMLRRQSDEPILIDFGSAKFLQPSTYTVTTTTNQYYTPYEQGRSEKRQSTLDVYSLAATLYFAVTGEKPEAAFDRKLYENSLKPPQQHCLELSDWLNQAILEGMALEPENRPQSMQEWLGFLHPPQPKKQQQESSKSSGQSRSKKYKSQLDYSTLPFIRLSFLLLLYILVGTLLGLNNVAGVVGAAALSVSVAVSTKRWYTMPLATVNAWYMAFVFASAAAWTFGFDATGAATWVLSLAAAWTFGFGVTGAATWVLSLAMTFVYAYALSMAGYWAIESVDRRYKGFSIFMILGITSTLGLFLCGVLRWWLKL